MALYIYVKFHKNISNGFQLTERTREHDRNVQRAITSVVENPDLWFMCSALFYIYVKFHENIKWFSTHRVDTSTW